MADRPKTIASLDEISGHYAAILCDVWGVLHNGVRHFESAAGALAAARERGLAVVLITNAPRPHEDVEAQLASLDVPEAAWDRVVTSGDVTRELVSAGPRKVFHLGPDRDLGLYDGLDIDIVEEFEANSVVCTGLFDDEIETPDDYAEMLRRMRARNLPMICANPDIVVERGDRLIYCAGAIAELYRELGGEVVFYGKPHRPIYERAMALAAERRGSPAPLDRVLAIGDSVRTDLTGAHGFGIDCLFVTRGIHSEDFEGIDQLDPASVKELFGHPPKALMRELRW